MDNLNYFQRLRHLILGGLEAGTAIAFVLITISVSFNVLIQYTYDPAPDRLAYANILWYGLLVVNFLVFLLGVMIMGLISSFVKPRGNFEPIFLGLTVGISMVLAIDYLIYLTDDPYSIDSFPQHLFMFNPDWPWQSFFAPYLVPNLINVGVLAYVSWKTTRLEMIKPRRRISYISVILVVCMLFILICTGFNIPFQIPIILLTFLACCLFLSGILSKLTIQTIYHWQRPISHLAAILIGLLVGIVFLYFINFILWVTMNPPGMWHSSSNVIEFLLQQKEFYIPNLLGILVSSYAGWKMNKTLSKA